MHKVFRLDSSSLEDVHMYKLSGYAVNGYVQNDGQVLVNEGCHHSFNNSLETETHSTRSSLDSVLEIVQES